VTALGYICLYKGISRAGALCAAAFSGAMPLTGLLLSVTLLGERAGWQQWTGATLVMAGMVLIGVGGAGKNNEERGYENAAAERTGR
jgi:drug/metabolite transporter (DMT)-like permease